MSDNYKEIYFFEYCKTCKHFDKTEEQEPCCQCLEEPARIDSHKPVNWEGKEK